MMGLWGTIKGVGEKVLDITSAMMLEPTTFIKSPTEAAQLVKERREAIALGDKEEAVAVVMETLMATAIGTGAVLGVGTMAGRVVVGKVLTKLAPTTIPKAIGLATATGILITSPTARGVVSTFIDDPTKLGRGAGEIIEGEKDIGLGEALITGGLVGAGVVLGAGAIELVEKFRTPEDQLIEEKGLGEAETPITPQTTTITTGRKPYKRRRATKTPLVRQSVRVEIINAPKLSNKTYLKTSW